MLAPPVEVMQTFQALLQEATAAGELEPTAMTVASADLDGRISARTVLLKDVDARGFVFYTNYASNKGRQLQTNPRAACLFLWKALRNQVQVKIEGQVESVSDQEADAYFASRPRGSQIGAWASLQSQALDQRSRLTDRIAALEQQYQDQTVPRPPHWSGFRVLPDMIEFWYGKEFRLHERQRHQWLDGCWQQQLLYP
jgi:pyridoxamine 5'-phosphate oxidase